MNMLFCWFHFVVFVLGSASGDDFGEQGDVFETDNDMENRAYSFKKKWGVEHVMRDLEHIKNDVKEMMDLKHTGQLSQLEMLFYMIRMHDFDNNGGLDGIEFRAALTHSLEHNQELSDEEKIERIEEMIESLLKVDDNNDGIVDYGELRSHLDREKREKMEAASNKQRQTET